MKAFSALQYIKNHRKYKAHTKSGVINQIAEDTGVARATLYRVDRDPHWPISPEKEAAIVALYHRLVPFRYPEMLERQFELLDLPKQQLALIPHYDALLDGVMAFSQYAFDHPDAVVQGSEWLRYREGWTAFAGGQQYSDEHILNLVRSRASMLKGQVLWDRMFELKADPESNMQAALEAFEVGQQVISGMQGREAELQFLKLEDNRACLYLKQSWPGRRADDKVLVDYLQSRCIPEKRAKLLELEPFNTGVLQNLITDLAVLRKYAEMEQFLARWEAIDPIAAKRFLAHDLDLQEYRAMRPDRAGMDAAHLLCASQLN